MTIRSKTLRLALLLSTILVAIIIAIQLFWLQKIYTYEEKQFNINVSKSIRSLYAKMELVGDVNDTKQKIIENPTTDVYLVRIDCSPPLDALWTNLQEELTDFDVFTDCMASIYSKDENKIIAEEYIDQPDAYKNNNKTSSSITERPYSYLQLLFPHRGQYILKQMTFWLASSALLLLVLIGLAASIFYLYKQKFLNETQKDFVNNFTHEFKTPLSVIKIAADVLQQKDITQHPDRLQSYSSIISQQTTHLQAQVQRLLQIAYTDNSNLTLNKETTNLVELVQQVIKDVQPLIIEKNASIHIEKTDNIITINVDKTYIALALVNLIENGLKYSVQPIINISFTQNNLNCGIQIADIGIGIDAKYHKKIFEKFFRVPSGEIHNAKGFGLGLPFVKNVIEAHKGSIKILSSIGNGSKFLIELPKN